MSNHNDSTPGTAAVLDLDAIEDFLEIARAHSCRHHPPGGIATTVFETRPTWHCCDWAQLVDNMEALRDPLERERVLQRQNESWRAAVGNLAHYIIGHMEGASADVTELARQYQELAGIVDACDQHPAL